MNLFGNSLKFTTVRCPLVIFHISYQFLQSGFVHVMLRELRRAEDDSPNKVKIELAVLDTGKVGEHYCCYPKCSPPNRVSARISSRYFVLCLALCVAKTFHRINSSTHSRKRTRYKLGLALGLPLSTASLPRKALVAKLKSGAKKVLVRKSKSLSPLKDLVTMPEFHSIWNLLYMREMRSILRFLSSDSTHRIKE